MFWSECGTFEGAWPHYCKDIMDIWVLLVLLLPAFATAGMYSGEPATYGTGYEDKGAAGVIGFDQFRSEKGSEVEAEDYTGSVSAEVMNEGNAYANAAADDYGQKAKTIEQNAKWFRTLVNEKQLVLTQVKKRANLLRAMAGESLQSAEQFRKAAAEKNQNSKALETKAREAESLSKEQLIQARELRAKMYNELKQYLDDLTSSGTAEANAETALAEVERQRSWGMYMEKQAQDMMSEAVKWERRSAESMDKAKKLKSEAAVEAAKAKEFEKKRKESEDAANEAEKKANEFQFFHMEFQLKSESERLQSALARIKAKYLQMIVASMAENASYLDMFAGMEEKDKALWEKRTASIKAEAKLLEASASKMLQNIEKLQASLKKAPSKEKKVEVVQEVKEVKPEPPKVEVKEVIPEKKV